MDKTQKTFLKAFCICMFFSVIIFSKSVFAAELNIQISEEYKEWNKLVAEEKANSLMPKTYSTTIPDSILNTYSKKVPSLVDKLIGNMRNKKTRTVLEDLESAYLEDSYKIGNKLNLRVENQKSTKQCWAFSMLKSFETNIALRNNLQELPDFSERHMDYATSKTFLDGVNKNGFNREVGVGGLPVSALAYLTNGQGAVLETEMPFEDNENKIKLENIDKEVDTIVTEYVSLPKISKKYNKDANGNTISVIYTDSEGNKYTNKEVEAIRTTIKKHIVEHGAIASTTAGNQKKYYNNSSNILNATNYNCNNSNVTRDHGITIVGWDDTYSKDNFAEGVKPSTDGAYIILNSYGEESFNNGYMYISYEDFFIESELYVIKNTEKKDYDDIYQSDFYGGIFSMGTMSKDTGYYANIYKRDKSKTEYITQVGVTVSDYVDVEIYINPNNNSMDEKNLIKIGNNEELLEPGYYRIEVEPTELKGDEFAIVVKQKSSNGIFYFSIEAPVEDTAYECVESENNSYYSLDGTNWTNLKLLSIDGFDMKKTDVCIKAFTVEELPDDENNNNNNDNNQNDNNNDNEQNDNNNNDNNQNDNNNNDNNQNDNNNNDNDQNDNNNNDNDQNDNNNNDNDANDDNNNNDNDQNDKEITIQSTKYLIKENEIYKIVSETSIEDFKKNIQTESNIRIFEQDNEITETNKTIKTGMKIRLDDDKEYVLIVRGDVNSDGKISLTDISKMILHYNETRGYELKNSQCSAADMNYDGKISLTDVSQMIVLYNQK